MIVKFYKGRGKKDKLKNYRGISWQSFVGKVYGKIVLECVKRITNGMMDIEQCGLGTGRGCLG